eukprot:1960-Prymnesium_polylepis.1
MSAYGLQLSPTISEHLRDEEGLKDDLYREEESEYEYEEDDLDEDADGSAQAASEIDSNSGKEGGQKVADLLLGAWRERPVGEQKAIPARDG